MSGNPRIVGLLAFAVMAGVLSGQTPPPKLPGAPDPNDIPVPPIKTSMPTMPGVDQLPNRPQMPDVMTLDNGKKVKTIAQWNERREQMKRILEYYAVGQAPPPPGNVKGHEISSQMLANGTVKYRLVHLTFGPKDSLSLDIGIFTPATGGPFPALISPSGTPPGATALPRLPPGANQGSGKDALLVVGPAAPSAAGAGGEGEGAARSTLTRVASAPRPWSALRGPSPRAGEVKRVGVC